MTDDDLKAILARCDAATPGPWRSFIEGRDHESGDSFIQTGGEDIYLLRGTHADQDFIASARQDIPRLVAALRAVSAASDSPITDSTHDASLP